MINVFNHLGVIDLSLIKDDEVAALDEPRKAALTVLIDSVLAKTRAEISFKAARERVQAAIANEGETFRLHQEANPPPSALETLRAAQASYRDHS